MELNRRGLVFGAANTPDSIQELAAVGPAQSYWMLANAPCGKDFP